MTQNREPPAYQEYAASMLSKLPFRTMTLQERGLLYTMRLECWINKKLPSNEHDLAKVLGLPVDEVTASLPAIMEFFEKIGNFIVCPELEDYRKHLAQRKLKQSQGGKIGSAITNSKRNKAPRIVANDSTYSTSYSQVSCQDSVESSVQSNSAKQNQTQFSKKEIIDDQFVRDYEAYEAAEKEIENPYFRASKGY